MIKMDNVDDLNSVREIDCEGISKELRRSVSSCWLHWQRYLLPILRTHILGLPQNLEWKKDVIVYLMYNKIEWLEDIAYNKVVKDVCPGQTTHSLRLFIFHIRKRTVKGEKILHKEPLHELASKRINDPGNSSFLCDETVVQKKLEHACSIVKVYEDFKAAKTILN